MTPTSLTKRQQEILDFIESQMQARGYPPSVREIGEAVGLTSPSTVHSHLASLQKMGYLVRDPSKPRAIEVRYDPNSGAAMERRPVRHVPLVGDVAAGTDVLAQENVEEIYPLPSDLDGDFIVARAQTTADPNDMVVAGIPGEEATVKTFTRSGDKVVLLPANEDYEPMTFDPDEVSIFGKVVTVLRKL